MGHEGPFGPELGMTPENDLRFAMLGGSTVGESALLRAYVWHCIALPLIAAILMAVHFWRVRREGFSGPAPVMIEKEEACEAQDTGSTGRPKETQTPYEQQQP